MIWFIAGLSPLWATVILGLLYALEWKTSEFEPLVGWELLFRLDYVKLIDRGRRLTSRLPSASTLVPVTAPIK